MGRGVWLLAAPPTPPPPPPPRCPQVREKLKTAAEVTDRFWGMIIDSVVPAFNFSALVAAELEAATQGAFLQFFDDFIAPGGAQRRQLAIEVEGLGAPPLTEAPARSADVQSFSSLHQFNASSVASVWALGDAWDAAGWLR